MKTIREMELENKFNKKIKYREKKNKNQRMIIGKQQEEIERLNKENKELKNRIGRAIYFFEKTKAEQGDIYRVVDSYESNCINFILTDNEIKFLNILKGSENNES